AAKIRKAAKLAEAARKKSVPALAELAKAPDFNGTTAALLAKAQAVLDNVGSNPAALPDQLRADSINEKKEALEQALADGDSDAAAVATVQLENLLNSVPAAEGLNVLPSGQSLADRVRGWFSKKKSDAPENQEQEPALPPTLDELLKAKGI